MIIFVYDFQDTADKMEDSRSENVSVIWNI